MHNQTYHDIKSGLNEFKNNLKKKNHVTFIDLILFAIFFYFQDQQMFEIKESTRYTYYVPLLLFMCAILNT